MPYDFKKDQKELYQPKKAVLVDVPKMTFIMIDGTGNPNTSETYKTAIEILYGLSYSIKMSPKHNSAPAGYFDYAIPPLEGLWWLAGAKAIDFTDKNTYCWTAMIRQPHFVTQEVFEKSKAMLSKKKPDLNLSAARLEPLTEGLCAQMMHTGPYDDEPKTIEALAQFITEAGCRNDISDARRHHEIYLNDPRKVAHDKIKTIIRLPVKRV
ncbi:MAG: GyrI-like domain-containing protein [Dehalococcoidia bacterium]|nr:GyrI-like domain-containing protein [Dehalococcoidia bacterium]